MKILIFLISILLNVLTSQIDSSEFYQEKQALKAVRVTLKEKKVTFEKKIEVTEFFGKEEPVVIYLLKGVSNNTGYAVFTQAKGRYDNFDYMIIVNQKFSIEKLRVLKYRSEHGGEISSKKWLEQFENYSSGELRYKKEISALSGATVSAGSLVADVPKVLKILKNSCQY